MNTIRYDTIEQFKWTEKLGVVSLSIEIWTPYTLKTDERVRREKDERISGFQCHRAVNVKTTRQLHHLTSLSGFKCAIDR